MPNPTVILPSILYVLLFAIFSEFNSTLAQIDIIQPTNSDRPCQRRPPGCNLNCPHGFAWGGLGICLCICQIDPCLNKVCSFGEVCIVSQGIAKCISQLVSLEEIHLSTVGECPRLVGGLCIERCHADSDCRGQMKCCSNGCGHECVLPVNVAPIKSSLPILPISGTNFAPEISSNSLRAGHPPNDPFAGIEPQELIDKVGKCPSKGSLKDRKCTVECNRDSDCDGVAKCCDTGCGRACSAPEKATTCVHLLSAVQRLPHKVLANGFVPVCTANGDFAPIQCDNTYCWCVLADDGMEIFGTKIPKDQQEDIRCTAPRHCRPQIDCPKSCPLGIKTDQQGCPVGNCDCKNVCDNV
uniref:Uncharacterized protein n=1 Tax=Acrobeloides nanus TaxID=290746 RepID=A0A914DWI9_9BILA